MLGRSHQIGCYFGEAAAHSKMLQKKIERKLLKSNFKGTLSFGDEEIQFFAVVKHLQRALTDY